MRARTTSAHDQPYDGKIEQLAFDIHPSLVQKIVCILKWR